MFRDPRTLGQVQEALKQVVSCESCLDAVTYDKANITVPFSTYVYAHERSGVTYINHFCERCVKDMKEFTTADYEEYFAKDN